MSEPAYASPVDQLLTLGEKPARVNRDNWMDYPSLGLTREHISDLIRMALDEALMQTDDDIAGYAPIHAWRALGQLRAVEAITPLFQHIKNADDEDLWWDFATEEIPIVYGMIGAPAIALARDYLLSPGNGEDSRGYAASALTQIALRNPGLREECVDIINRALEDSAHNSHPFNGFLIGHLLDLKEVASAPIIQRAFEAGHVDESIAGDWEDVQVELGLKAQRETPPRHYLMERILQNSEDRALLEDSTFGEAGTETTVTNVERHKGKSAQKKEKNKRKQAKKTRRANRRK